MTAPRQRRSLAAALVGALVGSACGSAPKLGPSVAADSALAADRSAPAQLIDCPSSPNCVSSTASSESRRAPAFVIDGDAASYQARLEQVIAADGGVVQDRREGYLWATYTSSVFRFVDDIEWLHDARSNHFDVRSASRLGYSDFGVNRKRVARLLDQMRQ